MLLFAIITTIIINVSSQNTIMILFNINSVILAIHVFFIIVIIILNIGIVRIAIYIS